MIIEVSQRIKVEDLVLKVLEFGRLHYVFINLNVGVFIFYLIE